MTSHDRGAQVLAGVLAALAGFVDAYGFIASGSFFVSFMSGNSTRAGVGLAQGSGAGLVAAGLIGAFLLGVTAGALAGHLARGRRRAVVLALVALLLAGAAASSTAGATSAAIGLMALAMGAENNVFERDGEVSLGVTYMTGSLVKLGQRIAAAAIGGQRYGWVPHLLLWLCFVGGVSLGAATYPHWGPAGLWLAACLAATLAAACALASSR